MKTAFTRILLSAVLIFLTGCAATQTNQIMQVSTIDAILAGAYDGTMSLEDLRRYGGFGIGTFDRLDGEMIVLDGIIYQASGDGTIHTPNLSGTTPFASVVTFENDRTVEISETADYKALTAMIDRAVPNMNIFCAVKVTGTFATMKVRSVPAQKKPYPPLTEVTKHQAVFNLNNVSGTIVGFRSPGYVKGISVPRYHLHFITDSRDSGGHILDFSLAKGIAEIDECNRFLMSPPEGSHDFGTIDLSIDRSKDPDTAEK